MTADSKSRVKEGAASPIKSSRPAQPLPKASAGPFDQKPKAAAAAPLKEPVPSRSHHPGPTPKALCNYGAHARLRRGTSVRFLCACASLVRRRTWLRRCCRRSMPRRPKLRLRPTTTLRRVCPRFSATSAASPVGGSWLPTRIKPQRNRLLFHTCCELLPSFLLFRADAGRKHTHNAETLYGSTPSSASRSQSRF